jgi:phosphopantothenoylcysteine decarboxylase / phosphopantothenate---cysteine ligase
LKEEGYKSAIFFTYFATSKVLNNKAQRGAMIHQEGISGAKSKKLAGKKIVLAVCGSIAAIESPKLARELMRHGADVICLLSEAGQKIIHPWALECITGKPTITEITGSCGHIQYCGEWAGKCDLLIISPATANTISKIANGIDDSIVTTFASTAIGAKIPLLIAPAMHESMIDNPFVQENITRLRKAGVMFVGPKKEEGKAKLDRESVSKAAISLF